MNFTQDLHAGSFIARLEEEVKKGSKESFLKWIEELIERGFKGELTKILNHLPVPAPSGKEVISNQQLLDSAQSGDIILWSGNSGTSRLIRFLSDSPFSHASIVFKGALDDQERGTAVEQIPRIFQATWSSFDEDIDGDDQPVERKVMLNDLQEVLASNESEDEPATLRVLKYDPGSQTGIGEKLAAFIQETDGDNYPGASKGSPSFTDYLRGLLGLPKKYPDTYFCSELVAGALQSMDILSQKKCDDTYAPASFSDQHYAELKKSLDLGFELEPEVRVSQSLNS